MTLIKDKKKVIGESFDSKRIASFLKQQPPEGLEPDYYILEKAYRGMNLDNFTTFVYLFYKEGHQLGAKDREGKTLLERIKTHRSMKDYAAAIEKHLDKKT